MIRPLPQTIVRAYSQLQSMSFQGLWPEIHRAWMTVDNVLYLWDYHTEDSHVQVRRLWVWLLGCGVVDRRGGDRRCACTYDPWPSSPCLPMYVSDPPFRTNTTHKNRSTSWTS